jgi:hypothetical protein
VGANAALAVPLKPAGDGRMTTHESVAATLTAAFMTGKRAIGGAFARAVALLHYILSALETPLRTVPARSTLDVDS